MKKLFYVAAVALVAALASCGNAKETTTEETTEPAADATEVVAEEVTEVVDTLAGDSTEAPVENVENAE